MAGVVSYDLEPPAATRHIFLIGSGNRQQVTVFSGRELSLMTLSPPLQLVTSSSLVVATDNRSLYSVVLFWHERRKTNMAGVVTYDLEPPIATCHLLFIGSGNRQQVTVFSGPFLAKKGEKQIWQELLLMTLSPPLQLVSSSSLVVAIDNRSLYSVVLFWHERRKTTMAGVVTYDLEPPIATRHFLLIDSGNRQQVTVFSGPFLARKEKNKYSGSCHL